jgi:hypothetical protein
MGYRLVHLTPGAIQAMDALDIKKSQKPSG